MERKALFYLLALIGGNVDKFYRFDGRYITPDANAPELTSTGKRALCLAFELFNGYYKHDKPCSVNQIMSGAGSYTEYFIEAIKIRYCGA